MQKKRLLANKKKPLFLRKTTKEKRAAGKEPVNWTAILEHINRVIVVLLGLLMIELKLVFEISVIPGL